MALATTLSCLFMLATPWRDNAQVFADTPSRGKLDFRVPRHRAELTVVLIDHNGVVRSLAEDATVMLAQVL